MSAGRIVVGGLEYDVTLTPTVQLEPDPEPTPVPTPVPTPSAVRIGSATHPLAGIDPTGTTWPGGRGPNELVVLTRGTGGVVTRTNRWGVEATVVEGIVTMVNDRTRSGTDVVGTTIPAGPTGLVLSGHGTAGDWLLRHALLGSRVELVVSELQPPTPAPAASRTTIATYLMMWRGTVGTVPAGCNQVRLAFAQDRQRPDGTRLELVGSGGQSMAELAAWVRDYRARGGQVLLSVGGQDGAVSTSDRAGFVADVRSIGQAIELDGIDWDIEASALHVADVLVISRALHRPGWVTSFVPPGGPPVGPYLEAAVACQRSGIAVQFGQQLFDTPVRLDQAIATVQRAVDAGLPPSSVLIGMMNPPGRVPNGYWDNATCEANMRAIRARWPDIGGAYLWEAGRDGSDEWAAAMGRVLS